MSQSDNEQMSQWADESIRYDRFMRGKWLLLSAAVILTALAIGALSLFRRQPPESVTVSTAPPPAVFAGSEVSLSGRIRAQEVVAIPAPVEGIIEMFHADIGQEVYEGQLLAEIKSAESESVREAAQADLDGARSRVSQVESRLISARLDASRAGSEAARAREELDRAEKNYLRQQILYREGAAARLTYEKARKEFESVKAEFNALDQVARIAEDQLASLTKQLDEARRVLAEKSSEFEEASALVSAGQVYSPVNGLVVGRHGRSGDEITLAVEDLFRIAVNLSALEVVLDPEPPVLPRIRAGQEAIVQVAEVPEGLPGKVKEVRDGQVIVEFVSPSPAVKPGLTAQVLIRLM